MPDWVLLDKIFPDPIPDGYLRICFIGHIEPKEEIDTFLEIVRDLLEKYNNIHIDVIGNDNIPIMGPLNGHEIFEDENSYNSAHPRLIFHDKVNDEQLRGFYAATDIVVAPSRFELFRQTPLEAMVFNKAIVGCNIEGMAEVIENGVTGILAEPGDSSSLAKALNTLIEDSSLRNQYGLNARLIYQNHFSEKVMAEKVSTSFISSIANISMAREDNIKPS
jgi:glycosyltransferase involved in cell wall biosynthesis